VTVLPQKAHQCCLHKKQYSTLPTGSILADGLQDHIYFLTVTLHSWLFYPLTEEDTVNSFSFLVSAILFVTEDRNFCLIHDFILCTIKSYPIPITLVFKVI